MGRRVLGNDPFQRGAAERPATRAPEPAVPVPPAGRRAPATVPAAAPGTRQPSKVTGQGRSTPAPASSAPAARAKRAATEAAAPPERAEPARARPEASRAHPEPPRPASSEPRPAPPEAPAAVSGQRGASAWLPDLPTLLGVLRSTPGLAMEAVGALEAAVQALRAGLGSGGAEAVDVYGRDPRLSAAIAPLVDFLYTRWFRVEVEGAERIPAGGALLVANHAGALPLDGPILQEALRRSRPDLPEARWLAEDQVFYAPLLGTLFNRLGAVRASPDSATRLLAEGRPVCIFPEGIQGIGKPFRQRYHLQRFGRGGFVKLALRTGRPVLPVAIVGGEESLPLLAKLPGGFLGVPYLPVTGPLPLPAKWRIRIGEPLAVPAGATERDLPLVESLVDATRTTIAQMLRELLGARAGVFLG
jgi:1-acyl-sn-glycerol-3-phosphate acyltransferase